MSPPPQNLPGWGRRVAAKLVDFLVYLVAGVVVGIAAALAVDPETAEAGFPPEIVLAFVAAGILYPWLMVGRFGQTLGKIALGIKVVRAEDGGRVSYLALGRMVSEAALGVFSVPLLASYLWPLWDERRQTLHDKIVRTVVVRP